MPGEIAKATVQTVLAPDPGARIRRAVVHTVLAPDPGARIRRAVVHTVLGPTPPVPNPNPVTAAIIAT